jgi:hypothetical protein
MTDRDIIVPAAIMSLIRGNDSVRGVADRLGVTESQVLEMHDVFVVGGLVAMMDFRRGMLRPYARMQSGPTTHHHRSATPEPDGALEIELGEDV